MKSLVDFAILSRGLSNKDKSKLLLFATRKKPATSLYLHITKESLDELYQFEHALRLSKIIYLKGREKSFEKIKSIQGNKVLWDIAGLWVDFDLFHTIKQKEEFLKYRSFWQKGKTNRAHYIGGKLYGYPSCCIAQYGKDTLQYIKKHYSAYAFYKRLHEIDKRFPLLAYTPCTLSCKKANEQHKLFSQTIKETSPSFYHHLREVTPYESEVIIDMENDLMENGKSIWQKKDGHDYVVLATKPFQNKYWFYSVLSKKAYSHGTVFSATITHHSTYGEVLLGRDKGIIPNLQHERNLPLLKREY